MKAPTFGQIIRGARLGYHWCSEVSAMMRLSGDGPFLVELCPPDKLPTAAGDKYHREWWGKDRKAIVDGIAPLRSIKAVKQPLQFTIGEDGNLLGAQ